MTSMLVDPPHALVEQAELPKELHPNVPSADGWGVAWYPELFEQPARYRTVAPMWRDENLRSMFPSVRAALFLAATRVATGTSERAIVNVQPFTKGSFATMHNGSLDDFERSFMHPLREQLSIEHQATVRGMTDAEVLFATFLELCQERGAQGMLVALRGVVQRVAAIAAKTGKAATLTMIACDGGNLAAIRWATLGQKPPTLYVRDDTDVASFASEPLEDGSSWHEVEPSIAIARTLEGERLEDREF